MSPSSYRPRRYPAVHGAGKVQVIIAVVLVLIGLISYFTSTQINPVTGEKQRVGMTPSQEIALGLQAAPQMAQQMGGVLDPDTNAAAAKVQELGTRLAYDTEAVKSPYSQEGKFNFYLLADAQTINAFALPGGQVFITRALYDRLENEAQLAGVLGHEVGHVIHRHGAEHMAKGQLGQMLVAATAVGTADDQGRGQMATAAAAMANQMFQLRYGRSDELESDDYGLKLMTDIGYHPRGMLGVMKVLAEASRGNRQPEFLATHPHPESRIDAIEKYLRDNQGRFEEMNLQDGQSLPPS